MGDITTVLLGFY